MVELDSLMQLLDADFVLPHNVAGDLTRISYNLRDKYSDSFIALHIGGSTVSGGAVAKSIVLGIDQQEAISDIDYGVILSSQMSLADRTFLHMHIKQQLEDVSLKPCYAFNAKNVYLVADDPCNMANRMIQTRKEKTDAATYLATYLLMPFGVVLPMYERKKLQNLVIESLNELGKVDNDFAEKIKNEMNRLNSQNRIIKKKHVSDDGIRNEINSRRLSTLALV